MLTESMAHLPISLAMFQEMLHGPTGDQLPRIFLRWSHFVAGIAWIGLLYFFNLVNVDFLNALDAPTKTKVIPKLMPKALWFFRWGAVITVLVGLAYYAMYILRTDVNNLRAVAGVDANVWLILIVWLLFPIITFAIEFFVIQKGITNDGRVLAVIVAVLVILMSVGIVWWINSQFMATSGGRTESFASNRAFSIGIGGAMGLIMLLNVWGIIWPAQKRVIAFWESAAGKDAPPPLPDDVKALGRKAFLASRTNAWLSLPMLFFMGTSHGDYIILGK